ncbi:MAG: hydroxyacylglutathione hydrolase [Rhodovarius sp.]|nr:hydroxyacylglutathione hydrolase [Rhodovarius sp.]MDW8316052.1 hydroxyacylglutathione hydrolase [Rhodovarius sp.]
MSLSVRPIPILADNYAWWLRDEATGQVAVVDPGDAAAVTALLDAEGCGLDWILLTHHHADHIAGTAELVARYGARVAGAAADAHRLPPLDAALRGGDSFVLGASAAEILETPGHTLGHIAFSFPGWLFCGDTLFSLGCGRLIEGTAEDLFRSLRRIDALPGETLIACGHEYTLANGRFALTVEPDNEALRARIAEAEAQRAAGRPTVPSTLASERAANPFLRAATVATLAERRAAKDKFR